MLPSGSERYSYITHSYVLNICGRSFYSTSCLATTLSEQLPFQMSSSHSALSRPSEENTLGLDKAEWLEDIFKRIKVAAQAYARQDVLSFA